MTRLAEVFGDSPVVLPVVHPIGRPEALRSVGVAAEAGARGVFLIDQGIGERDVLRLVLEVRAHFPGLWVGVNLLRRSPAAALEVALAACEGRIDGIWCDDAMIDEHAAAQPAAEEMLVVRRALRWTGLYFGGVAFKYQRTVAAPDLARAAAVASRYVDAICTSGPGTGLAADPEKLRALHAGANGHAVALASGVTADNVRAYLPYASALLVGTGIEERFGVIDPRRLAALLAAAC